VRSAKGIRSILSPDSLNASSTESDLIEDAEIS
jgi:hypothetical protein